MIKFKQLLEKSETPEVWHGIEHGDKDFFRPAFKHFTNTESLNSDEKASVSVYSDDGHKNINGYHRNPENPSMKFPSIKNSVERRSKHLDSAIAKSTANAPMHLWRGTDKKLVEGFKEGQEFHDKGYVSTSMSPQVARGFSSGYNTKHMFHIKLPKGSKVLDLEHHKATTNAGENEFLLPRNSKFRYEGKNTVKERDEDGELITHHVHHLTYLGQHHD